MTRLSCRFLHPIGPGGRDRSVELVPAPIPLREVLMEIEEVIPCDGRPRTLFEELERGRPAHRTDPGQGQRRHVRGQKGPDVQTGAPGANELEKGVPPRADMDPQAIPTDGDRAAPCT